MLFSRLPGKYNLVCKKEINASAAEVWQVIRDFNNVYIWAPAVTASYGITNIDEGVGAGRHCKVKGFGEIDEHVTEWEDGVGFTYSVTPLGPLGDSHSRWVISPVSDNSSVVSLEYSYNLRFGIIGKLMHMLMMRNKLTSGFNEGLGNLKKRVETGETVRPILSETELRAA